MPRCHRHTAQEHEGEVREDRFDAKFLAEHSEDSIKTVLVKGKSEDMKSFKTKLTGDEIDAVAKYVRELAQKHHT